MKGESPQPRAVEVTQGQFVIESVDELPGSDHHRAWYIDCASKYPEVVTGGSLDERAEDVMILPDERSMHLNETTETPTGITFPVPDGWERWTTVTHGGRYTVIVVMLRMDELREVWRREDGEDDADQPDPEGR